MDKEINPDGLEKFHDKIWRGVGEGFKANRSNVASPALEISYLLGFLEKSVSSDGYHVDPTRAVRSILPAIFDKNPELRVQEFISAIENMIPILEGGPFAKKIKAILNEQQKINPDIKSLALNPEMFTPSLSIALLRLESAGELVLRSSSADDEGSRNIRVPGDDSRSINSVRWKRGNK